MINWLLAHFEQILGGAFLCFLAAFALTNLPEIKHELIKKAAQEIKANADVWCEVFDLVMVLMVKAHLKLERASEPVPGASKAFQRVAQLRQHTVTVFPLKKAS